MTGRVDPIKKILAFHLSPKDMDDDLLRIANGIQYLSKRDYRAALDQYLELITCEGIVGGEPCDGRPIYCGACANEVGW